MWKKRQFLKPFLQASRGIDLGFSGMRFTWSNGRSGLACIREKIDRAVVDQQWVTMFPKAEMEHLPIECSDHSMIFLRMEGPGQYNCISFQFIKAWVSDKSTFSVVENVWEEDWNDEMESHQLWRSLFNTSKALRKWNKEYFGFANTKIKALEEELDKISSCPIGDSTKRTQVLENLQI